jgi:hypothetical protein
MTMLLVAVALSAFAQHKATAKAPPAPALKIIQDSLHDGGGFYFVKGTVYNPHDKAVKNVVINYYIWKRYMGKEGHGTRIRDTGGLVTATIKYLPPKQSVDFTTVSNDNAPVFVPASGMVPDPLNAEITAEWDQP